MKIKEFFEKKWVKVTEGIIIALASSGLIFSGVDANEIANIPQVVVGVFTAIEALITLIQGFTTKELKND